MTTDASDTSAETRADVLAGTILDLEAERTAGDTRLEVPDEASDRRRGQSLRLHDSVLHLILQRYPYTLALTLAALVIGIAASIPAGILNRTSNSLGIAIAILISSSML